MLKQYDHLKQSEEVLKEIGICSTSPSQLACLVELPLPFLFSCLQLFATWVRDGIYDFNTLPLVVKTQMTYQDLQLIQQIPLKWTGRCSIYTLHIRNYQQFSDGQVLIQTLKCMHLMRVSLSGLNFRRLSSFNYIQLRPKHQNHGQKWNSFSF